MTHERLTQEQIKEIIPHRNSFLFLESVEEIEYGVRAKGRMIDLTKHPIIGDRKFPSIFMIEVLAELGAVVVLGLPENKGKIGVLAGVDDFKFRGTLQPGSDVLLESEIIRLRSNYGKGRVKASANNDFKVEGTISFGVVDRTLQREL